MAGGAAPAAAQPGTGGKAGGKPGPAKRGGKPGAAEQEPASEEIVDMPSTPIVPSGAEGPPVLTVPQENVSATENHTGYITALVQSNPVPDFRFFQGDTELFEGGRYKIVTDGSKGTVHFCINKCKTVDEGTYSITATNCHGEHTVSMMLLVGPEGGMDFRAMLAHRKKAKRAQENEDPDWKLKGAAKEPEIPQVLKKKPDEFVKVLKDLRVKQGKDTVARFEAVFSKRNVKAKWFKNQQEIFMGKKYKITSNGDLHVLEVSNPTKDDEGVISITCLEVSCKALLEVDAPDPVYKFTKNLPKTAAAHTGLELALECTCNSSKAPVQWYKDDIKLNASERILMDQDAHGKKFLKVFKLALTDTGEYACKIVNTTEKTQCKVAVTDKKYQLMKMLKSQRVSEKDQVILECEVDEKEAPVTWYKDGKELKEDKHCQIVADGKKRRLIIKQSKVADEGAYACKTNAEETTCELIVEPANRWNKKLKDTVGLEGTEVVLEAELLDRTVPVKWFKNGQEIKADGNVQILSTDGKHQLILKNAALEDAGEYSIATKDMTCKCNLAVQEAEKAPIIKPEKDNYAFDQGKPFVVEVPYRVPGVPASPVTCKLECGGKVISTKDVDQIVKENAVVLTFRKPIRENTGSYSITLSNAQGDDTKTLNINVQDVPGPPEGPLNVTDVFKDRCKLSWQPPKDDGGCPVTGYVIERQDISAKGGWAEVLRSDTTSADITDLTNKKEYKFRVRAVNKKGVSQPLTADKTTLAKDPIDEPSSPNSVQVIDFDENSADVKWEPPESDGGAPIEEYIIEVKEKSASTWTQGACVKADQTRGKVKGLKEGGEYEFRVIAVNKVGNGNPSEPTKPVITKPKPAKPYLIGDGLKPLTVRKGAVINLNVEFGGEPMPTIVWSHNGQEIKEVAGKTSLTSSGGKVKTTALITKDSVRADSGKYVLFFKNDSGECSTSCEVIVLDKPTKPRGPLNLDKIRENYAEVSWKPPQDDGGSELQGYVIEKMDIETGMWVPAGEVGPEKTSAKITGLQKNKKYKFRVKAVNKQGISEPLEQDGEIIAKNPYEEPGSPSDLAIDDYDNTMVDLKWNKPENDGGRPILHYIIEMKDKLHPEYTEVFKTDGPITTAKITGLKENSVVQFRVKAVNKAGLSKPSNETPSHTVKHRNLKPRIDRKNLNPVTLKAGRKHAFDVDISGEPPPDVKWTFDDIEVKSDDYHMIKNVDYHSDFAIVNAHRKQTGKYTITATNRNGSDSVVVELTVLGKPSPPRGPLEVADVRKEGCKLKWKPPEDDGGKPVKHYEVEKFDKQTGKWTRCGKSDTPEFDVTGLVPNKEYLFRCVAVNEEGESQPLETTETIVAKDPWDPSSKPGMPEIVDYDNKMVQLKWDPPENDGGAPIEKYIIQKKDKNSLEWEKVGETSGSKLTAQIEPLKEGAEMQFRVVAVNRAGPSEPSDATKLHKVKHRKLKPHIHRANLEKTAVKKGELLHLDIKVDGEPPPKITWLLKDAPLLSKDNMEISVKDYQTSIKIKSAIRANTGVYVIVAENEFGLDKAEVEINVLSEPSSPKGPLQVSDLTAKSCKLKWEKPEDDGGKPLQAYLVEKLDPLTGSWVPVTRVEPSQTDCYVPDLVEGKKYQFRVKAVNAEGQSEPLTTENAIIAKNPYDPAGPAGKPDITDWSEKHVDLKWSTPKSDGGAPITGYVIEAKEKSSTQWVEMATTHGPKPEGKCEGLTKGKEYQFRVRAINKAGLGEPSEPTGYHLCKERFLAPKIIREKLENVTVRAGFVAKTLAETIGEPPPAITWLFNGIEVSNDNSHQITSEPYKSFFSLSNSSRKDSGKYTIRATNGSGTDEAVIELNILDRPSPPEGPLTVTDVHATHARLNWNKPKDDGGLPIEKYVIEKMDLETGIWEPAGRAGKDAVSTQVEGLIEGKKYHFRVKAVNEEGSSDPLETDVATLAKNPFDAPGAPGIPTLKDYDKDFVVLGWDAPLRDGGAPITGWIIEKKEKGAVDFVECASIEGSTPCGKVTGLTEGEKYEFRVRAVNKAGKGQASDPTLPILVKHKNLKPCIDRTNLKPTVIKVGQVYSVEVKVRGEPPPKLEWFHEANTLPLATDELYAISNNEYCTNFTLFKGLRKLTGKYRIKATNRNGEDEAELELNITGKPGPCCGPLQANDVTKNGCTLAWKPPEDDGGQPIDYYEVEKFDEQAGIWIPCGSSSEPNFEVTNLRPGKSYKFRVRAVNKEGAGENLVTQEAVVAKDPFEPPGQVDKPDIIDWDKDRVEIAWTAPKDTGGAPVEKFVVEKRKKGAKKWNVAKEVSGKSTTTTITKLEENEEYEFRVIAVNLAGPGEPSEPSRSIVCKPRRLHPLIDRTNLKKTSIRHGQACKFDVDVKGEPAPEITWLFEGKPVLLDKHFKVDVEDYHTLFILAQAERKLHAGMYTIMAKNEHGTDEASVQIEIFSKPDKPKGPLKVSDVHATGCTLKWDKPDDNGGEPISQYIIEKLDTETGCWVPCATSKKPEANVEGLIPGKKYKFRVMAANSEGVSEPLQTETDTLAKNPFEEPGKPGKPEVTDFDKHFVQLKWEPPAVDGGTPVIGYVIEKKPKNSTSWQLAAESTGTDHECRVGDLLEGVEYEFRVKAINKTGPGPPSDSSDAVLTRAKNRMPFISLTGLKNVTLRAGETLRLCMDVGGEPLPTKLWFKGERQLTADDRARIEGGDVQAKLTVSPVSRQDSGTYKLVVKNPNGQDDATVSVTVLDKPSPPEGPLEVSGVYAEGCKLSWKPPLDDGGTPVENYLVEKMDTLNGCWVPCGRVLGTDYNVDKLVPGHEYKFRVKAVTAEGESDALETEKPFIAKDPYDPPGAPQNAEIADWDRDWMTLKWDPPIKDGGSLIKNYIVEKKEKNSSTWVKAATVDGNTTNAKVIDLIFGETYEFRVKAVNDAGPGEPSESTRPQTARARRLAPKIDRKNLKPVSIRVGQLFEYDIKVEGEPSPVCTWVLRKQEVVDLGPLMIENMPYKTRMTCDPANRSHSGVYKLIAKNEYGIDEADVEVEVLSKPSSPEGPLIVSDVTKSGCHLAWKKPKDDGGQPVDHYHIEKQDPETGAWVPVGNCHGTDFDVTGLTPGKSYMFRVSAVSREGKSEPLVSMVPIVAKDAFDPPGAPGKPEPTDWNRNYVNLKWTPPETDGGAPVSHYIIEKRLKGFHKWIKAGETSGPVCQGTADFLEEGKEYTFRVVAVNAGGLGEPSNPSRPVTTKPRFLAPKIDQSTLAELRVRIGEPFRFDVAITGEPAPEVQWLLEDVSLSDSDPLVIENVPYHTRLTVRRACRKDGGTYTIIATNTSGEDRATVRVVFLERPGPPNGPLHVDGIHSTGCQLTWKPPDSTGGMPLDGYLVEKFDTATGLWVPAGKTKEPRFTVTGLTTGHKYKFRVKAFNKEGESEPLESDQPVVAKNLFDPPGRPLDFKAVDWDSDFVDLEWRAPDDDGGAPIEKYVIERCDKHGRWRPCAEVEGDQLSASLTSADVRMPGVLRVRAVNRIGLSEPSVTSGDEFPKPRKRKRQYPPYFTFPLRNRVIQLHLGVRLLACLDKKSQCEVTWFKDGRQLSQSEVTTSNTDGVVMCDIGSCSQRDAGRYMCRATNPLGEAETSCLLAVEEKHDVGMVLRSNRPYYTGFPMRSDSRFRSDYIDPPPLYPTDIEDEDDCLPIDGRGLHDIRSASGGITEAATAARGSGGSPLAASPSFTSTLNDTTVRDGEPLTLLCVVAGEPKPDVCWYKDGEELASSHIVSLQYKGREAILQINEVYPEDGGVYSCRASNPSGTAETQCRLNIVEAATPVSSGIASEALRVVKHLKSSILKDGDKVTLEVKIVGSSKFKVFWLQNGQEIKESKDFKMSSDNDIYRLEIAEIFPEDSGVYTCEAIGDAGRCFSTCSLAVLVPGETLQGPRFSIYPRSTTVTEGQEAIVRLTTERDPTALKWIKDGKELKDDNRRKTTRDGRSFELRVLKCCSSDSGQYTAVAVDKSGESLASFCVNVVVA